MTTEKIPRLAIDGVSKRFPGVLANDNVSFEILPGEVHALLGENGAGKSTLVKMVYGLLQPDGGAICWEGKEVTIKDPASARGLGIGMVFQHFSLFEALSVLENVALGMDDPGPMDKLAARIVEVSERYGLPLDPTRMVDSLSVGERQRIEIVRCLLQNPRLLIMDEPTSVLTPQEVERLFETLRRLSSEGCSILYISHKLEEIKTLCDRATVLRGGRVVGACDPRQETAQSLAAMMIGSELAAVIRRQAQEEHHAQAGKPPRLVVEGLNLPSMDSHGISLKQVSFSVRGGEIFGIAGVAGNGQTELQAALAGERIARRAEDVQLDGEAVGLLDAGRRRRKGLASVPEERNGHGAVPGMSLVDNVILTGYGGQGLMAGPFLRRGAARSFADKIIARFDVRTPGAEHHASSLSGGNLQKFIVGREILQSPSVLVVAQPTWGVDAGAAATIHQALIELAGAGAAIVVISQDLDELLAISDRLAVINVGRMSRPLETATADIAEIGLLMGGIHGADHGTTGQEGELRHGA